MDETNLVLKSDHTNTFYQMMIGIGFPDREDRAQSIFNRACAWSYKTANFDDVGYKYIQIFEPGVLNELIALDNAQGRGAEQTGEIRGNNHIAQLDWLHSNLKQVSTVQRLNLAAAYASFCRVGESARILETISDTPRVRDGDLRFEYLMLKFVVCNRLQDRAGSRQAMAAFLDMGKNRKLSVHQIIEVSCQATVWYHKTSEIDKEVYTWFLRKSNALVRDSSAHVGNRIKSSWYRATAMIPSAENKHSASRELMSRAKEYALRANGEVSDPYVLNELKTYYESTIKEHLYYSKDYAKAELAGLSLLKIDPYWSPNWAEVAQVYMTINRFEKAKQLLNKAITLGPPYLNYYHYLLAECECQLGDIDTGLQRYRSILSLDKTNRSSILSGIKWAGQYHHPEHAFFKSKMASQTITQEASFR